MASPGFGSRLVGLLDDYGQQKRQQQAASAWITALKRNPDDPERAIDEIRPYYPEIAHAVATQLYDERKKAMEAAKLQSEAQLSKNQALQPILAAVRDEQTWRIAQRTAASLVGPDGARLFLGDRYDPDVLAQGQDALLSEQQRVIARNNAATQAQKALEFSHTQAKDAPGIAKEWTAAAALALSTADTPEEWDAALQTQRALGAPSAVLAQFPQQFTPDAQAIAQQIQMGQEGVARVADAKAGRQLQATGQAETARHNRAVEARTGATAPVAVIGPDGQPVYVSPQQAMGMRPASTREQGRPVTSGDAGTITDLQTALSDLDTLTATLQGDDLKGATGTTAAAGAALPNVITDLTGWGTTAKQKQAVIDRVKQVIGKALEGGVLRKEDEIKYAKILPTISDTPSVAAAKLAGLKDAIQKRVQTTYDSLEDAGYDVSRFRGRQGAAPAGPRPTMRFNPATGKVEAMP